MVRHLFFSSSFIFSSSYLLHTNELHSYNDRINYDSTLEWLFAIGTQLQSLGLVHWKRHEDQCSGQEQLNELQI